MLWVRGNPNLSGSKISILLPVLLLKIGRRNEHDRFEHVMVKTKH